MIKNEQFHLRKPTVKVNEDTMMHPLTFFVTKHERGMILRALGVSRMTKKGDRVRALLRAVGVEGDEK